MKSYNMFPKYLCKFIKRKSFSDFLRAMNYHVDPKEWTECWGMYNIISQKLYEFIPDKVIEIGSGKRPTISTFLLLNIKILNEIDCIDPKLDCNYSLNIKGLNFYPIRFDEYVKNKNNYQENILVICNHAHISSKEIYKFVNKFKDWMYITCPCCTDNRFDHGEYHKDPYIWSSKNEIFVFKKDNKNGII